jgi:predicted transposase YbfD/YdcC
MKANGYFEFLTFFEELPDPRHDRGQNHLLIDMVALALCGTICGADTWADIERFSLAHQAWFEQFLELPNGVPSHDTFGRVFRCLDTAEFQTCLSRWVEHLQFSLKGRTIAIDGKTLRGSHDHASGQKPLHIINAWAKHVSFCLGSISVDDKSNEIPAVQELLSILNLKGGVVTADAMHCQKETVKKIIEKGADYVIQVKGNQQTLLNAIRSEMDRHEAENYASPKVRRQTIKERNRTREEVRTCIVAPAPAELKSRWAGLKTIGLICRTRTLADGTEQTDVSYFISSLETQVRPHMQHLRNHWSVENSLHHSLDVTFAEDASRIRKGNGPEIISAFRRLGLSILKSDTTIKDNVRGKRLLAGWNLNNLKKILSAFQAT